MRPLTLLLRDTALAVGRSCRPRPTLSRAWAARRVACSSAFAGRPHPPPSLPPPAVAGPALAAATRHHHRRPHPFSSTAAARTEENAVPVDPHTPLCERPPIASVSLAALGAWDGWARAQVAAVGDGLAADGGPTAAELQTELRWFLEDAVAGPAGPAGEVPPHPAPADAAPAWSSLAPDARAAADDSPLVWLRSPLHDLTARWTARLASRVPFQYTVGAAHWRDLVLAVGPGVLCPRPETEQLVDLALAAVRSGNLPAGAWADVCTGSGAVAVGLVAGLRATGLPLPDTVWAADVCPTAAGWARANVARLGFGGSVTVVEGDLLEALPPGRPPLAGLLSNPPYIPSAQMPGLQPEVGRHEPALALDGGDAAGLVTLRRLCAGAAGVLAPGGFLGLETAGHGQAEQVAGLLLAGGAGFRDVTVHDDAFGVARFVTARAGAEAGRV